MSIPGDIGAVPLKEPIFMGGIGQGEIEQAADNIVATGETTWTKDQIVSYLSHLKETGGSLSQKDINLINADNPALPRPMDLSLGVQDTRAATTGNKWLSPNPFATFTINMLELAHILSKIKLQESEKTGEAIVRMAQSATEIADMIKDAGYAEAVMHYVSGGMAIGSGLTSAVGGYATKKFAANNTAKFAKSNPDLQPGGYQIVEMQRINMMVEGVKSSWSAADNFTKAVMTLKKTNAEALRQIEENVLRTIQQELDSSRSAYQTSAEMITQTLQQLQKIIDEAYKAHSMGSG